ncbi:YheV family putative zinc ribbon protein [Microbulbifer guangxiensis]|uniref:YheV family putative zinc ribbon protein n=1 Tax=Microbulbifer guangxiensis TaxID=2904249 RepID=UPI001F3D9C41|nr:YheV family putative zinc ribbon protein [Microbulbifer guangxiensis]
MHNEEKKPVKKRFIAGAVCPRCGEMDTIVNYRFDDKNYRECVSCGFKDEIRIQSGPAELPTRVNERRREEAIEAPVKILDPDAGNKKDKK